MKLLRLSRRIRRRLRRRRYSTTIAKMMMPCSVELSMIKCGRHRMVLARNGSLETIKWEDFATMTIQMRRKVSMKTKMTMMKT